ncbi:MAG: glyoxalase [Propionibacteriales bacterium]|nr:glyoxalase [Propionibacteriales bacterium]
MTDDKGPSVWPTLKYDDAHAALRFLVDVFGFEERLVVPGETSDKIAHAELRWPAGGGVMFGSTGTGGEFEDAIKNGVSSVYIVTDDPDAAHARAMSGGAEEVIGLRDEDYGSRGFTVRDPEGNLWTFGTYAGA